MLVRAVEEVRFLRVSRPRPGMMGSSQWEDTQAGVAIRAHAAWESLLDDETEVGSDISLADDD